MVQESEGGGQVLRHGADDSASIDRDESATAEPATRREVRKQQNRQRLLDAARGLFVSQGFDETSYDDIAREAGLARQTAFNHFSRKDDFVAAWVDERRAELQSAIRHHYGRSSASPTDAATRLLIVMRVMADVYEHRRDEGRVFMTAWVRSGGPIFDAPVAARLFASVVRDGQRAGEFVDHIDAEEAGEVIRAVYFDVLWRWASPYNEVPPGGLFEALVTRVQLVLTGLSSEPERLQLRKLVSLARTLEVARLATSQESSP